MLPEEDCVYSCQLPGNNFKMGHCSTKMVEIIHSLLFFQLENRRERREILVLDGRGVIGFQTFRFVFNCIKEGWCFERGLENPPRT